MKNIRSEAGASLPLLIVMAAFAMIAAMLLVNIQQTAIGDMRVADYAQSLALTAARDGPEAAESAEQVIEVNQGLEIDTTIEAIDSKTFAATVCFTQPLIFEVFEVRAQRVCERRMSRWLAD
jgi:hypothetical protein